MPARPDWVIQRRRQIGHRIAQRRAALDLSIDDLAGASGLDRKTIMRAENARRSPPLDVLLLIAHGLDCDLGELVRKDGPRLPG